MLDSEPTQTLESEVKGLVNEFHYWAKFIAEKVLAGKIVSEEEYGFALLYLLEDLKLAPETNKPELNINYSDNSRNYKPDLRFQKSDNVEGVTEPINLNEEITRYELIRSKIKKSKKT
jgi:hypothetical protein